MHLKLLFAGVVAAIASVSVHAEGGATEYCNTETNPVVCSTYNDDIQNALGDSPVYRTVFETLQTCQNECGNSETDIKGVNFCQLDTSLFENLVTHSTEEEATFLSEGYQSCFPVVCNPSHYFCILDNAQINELAADSTDDIKLAATLAVEYYCPAYCADENTPAVDYCELSTEQSTTMLTLNGISGTVYNENNEVVPHTIDLTDMQTGISSCPVNAPIGGGANVGDNLAQELPNLCILQGCTPAELSDAYAILTASTCEVAGGHAERLTQCETAHCNAAAVKTKWDEALAAASC